ncbi:MAG: Cof-type HAD-IIB family hydrolase [Lachnospiraceae bacterium]|nr:Cof-type HAD-IIB family hydrolase [Lachnospiraceae bacterium]
MGKKVLFFDVDGTLVDGKNEIPKSAFDAIKKTRENGNLVFINSGRCYGMLHSIEKMIDVDGLLCGCGTEIMYHGESLFNYVLDRDVKERVIASSKKYNIDVIAEGHDGAAYSGNVEETRMQAVKDTIMFIETLGTDMHIPYSADFNMAKFCIQADELSDVEGFKKEFEKDFDVIDRHDGFYECVPNGYSKGTAVDWVLNKFDIKKEDAYCFGDSTNDLTMFAAGINAIAMGEHSVELEEYATFITKNLEDDGVEYAMKHYGLI